MPMEDMGETYFIFMNNKQRMTTFAWFAFAAETA